MKRAVYSEPKLTRGWGAFDRRGHFMWSSFDYSMRAVAITLQNLEEIAALGADQTLSPAKHGLDRTASGPLT